MRTTVFNILAALLLFLMGAVAGGYFVAQWHYQPLIQGYEWLEAECRPLRDAENQRELSKPRSYR